MLMLYAEETIYPAVCDGRLQIDDQGRIWRVSRKTGQRRRAEHQVPLGYLQIRLMIKGHRIHALAHRLVWRHVNGPIPEGMTINHCNGNKADNRPANLELATPAEQAHHALHVLKRGRLSQKGEHNVMAKLTWAAVRDIRVRRAMGESLKAIANDYGVTDRAISKVALRQRWVESPGAL